MGCFNVIDGFTGLEIHNDEEVELFFLINNQHRDGFTGYLCSTTSCFTPLVPPIKATYNEYGWFVIEECALSKFVQEYITNNIIIQPKSITCSDKKNELQRLQHEKDNNLPLTLLSLSTIGKLIHCGELYVKNKYGKTVPVFVSKFAVNAEIYNTVTSQELTDYDKNSIRSIIGLVVNAVIDRNDNMDAQIKAYQIISDASFYINHMITNISDLVKYMTDHNVAVHDIIDLVYRSYVFNEAMDTTRKLYLPQQTGNQCFNYNQEIEHLEMVLKFVKEQQEKYNNEYED